jgi:epoxyqueuosine reductase
MPNSISDLKAEIAGWARAQGFDVVRFATAEAAPKNREGLSAYLAAGHHGGMDWM